MVSPWQVLHHWEAPEGVFFQIIYSKAHMLVCVHSCLQIPELYLHCCFITRNIICLQNNICLERDLVRQGGCPKFISYCKINGSSFFARSYMIHCLLAVGCEGLARA